MLKLFFLIITLTTLVTLARSEIEEEWICKESNQKGNCSSSPKFKYFIKEIINEIDNYEYPDYYYCPFNIVELYSKCVHSYYKSCYANMTTERKYMLLMNLPPIDNLRILCTKGRLYKKEFREHIACLKTIKEDDVQTDVLRKQWLQNLELLKLKYQPSKDKDIQDKRRMDRIELQLLRELNPEKCQNLTNFFLSQYVKIRTQCGLKTEKFYQQLYSNNWPLSTIMKNCEKKIYYKT